VANNYLKAQKYAALAVAALDRTTVLPQVFTKYDGGNFRGAEDDTVSFKLPGVTQARDYEWRTRTNPIVLDKIGRTKISIKLDTHTYSAVPITDEELTLDLSDFASEILSPQLVAVIERLEGKVMAGLRAAPFNVTDLNAAEADDPYDKALDWSAALDAQFTPVEGRKLLLGSNAWKWLMKSEALVKYDKDAAATAFRKATFGEIANFDVIKSARLAPNEIFAVHSSALVMANVAPENPDGATYSARQQYKGMGVRVLKDYDPNFLRDRSIVSTFTGISSVNDQYLTDENGLVLDADGNPQITGKNVRGGKGTFTPTPVTP
jgi:hypothetical protein